MKTEEFIRKRTHEEWASLIEELREHLDIPARTLYESVAMSPSTFDKIKKECA